MSASRPGPRPRGPFEDKRATLTTRITEETRKKLDKAASANGNSLSQEIESRLEQSFQYGGPRTSELLRRLAAQAETWPDGEGDKWLDDPRAYQSVKNLWDAEIIAAEPRPDLAAVARRVHAGEAAALRLRAGNYSTDKEREEDIVLVQSLGEDPNLTEFQRLAFQSAAGHGPFHPRLLRPARES
jgi:hypothetical protein